MSNNSIPQKRPRRNSLLPENHDPARRLLAAVVLQSVVDHLFPTSKTPKIARLTAADFLNSADGQGWLAEFGIPARKIELKLRRPS